VSQVEGARSAVELLRAIDRRQRRTQAAALAAAVFAGVAMIASIAIVAEYIRVTRAAAAAVEDFRRDMARAQPPGAAPRRPGGGR
jgi:hypothetical protein